MRICVKCGKEIVLRSGRQVYCSRNCRNKAYLNRRFRRAWAKFSSEDKTNQEVKDDYELVPDSQEYETPVIRPVVKDKVVEQPNVLGSGEGVKNLPDWAKTLIK